MGSGVCLPNLDTYNVYKCGVCEKEIKWFVGSWEVVDWNGWERIFALEFHFQLGFEWAFAKEILRLQSRCGRLPCQFKLWNLVAF